MGNKKRKFYVRVMLSWPISIEQTCGLDKEAFHEFIVFGWGESNKWWLQLYNLVWFWLLSPFRSMLKLPCKEPMFAQDKKSWFIFHFSTQTFLNPFTKITGIFSLKIYLLTKIKIIKQTKDRLFFKLIFKNMFNVFK